MQIDAVIAIDFETANRSRSSPCSLGIYRMEFPSCQQTDGMELLIDPEEPFDAFNTMLHGISEKTVKGAPAFPAVLEQLKRLVTPSTLVIAHNAGFDISVIRASCEKYGIDFPCFPLICTRILSRAMRPGHASYSLLNVIARLCNEDTQLFSSSFFSLDEKDIVVNARAKHHRAYDDAETCAYIFHKLISPLSTADLTEIATVSRVNIGHISPDGYKPTTVSFSKAERHRENKEAYKQQINISENEENPFFGKTVVFTGTLLSMVRAEAEAYIESIGGRTSKKVSGQTDFLVHGYIDPIKLRGAEKSAKLAKAEEMAQAGSPIQLISEEDFLQMIDFTPLR